MSHLVLLLYSVSVCCGIVLIGLALRMSRSYRQVHLRTYAVHLILLNAMAVSLLALRYIQVNVSPAKEGIVGGVYVLFMGLCALDFAAIVGYVATFVLMTNQLQDRAPSAGFKAVGWLALGAAGAVWAKGVYDIIAGRSVDVLMVSLRVLDYFPKVVILALSLALFERARRLPASGKRVALKGLGALYVSTHAAFFVTYALKNAWPPLFAFAWPAYFLVLNLVPLFTLGTFLHHFHGKKLSVAGRAGGFDAALEGLGVTKREREIIRLACTGKTNREIEACLFVSEKTVKFHLYNAYRKLGIRNRVELVNLVQDLCAEVPERPS